MNRNQLEGSVTNVLGTMQQWFGDVTDHAGQSWPAGRQTWRVDVAPTFRLTNQVQVKLQYSLQQDRPARERYTQSLSAQLTVRF